MSLDSKNKELLYKTQNQQKISIYMALVSPFGLIVFSLLIMLFLNDIFDSIVPVFVIGAVIMLYFFRKFVSTRKHDYQELPIFKKLISFRNYVRGENN